jgi:fructose-bisphosphate aldolase, class II
VKFSEYLKRAQKDGWAIGQFNVSTFEAMKAVFQAAKSLNSPVIIGTSEGESRYLGLSQAVTLVESFKDEFKVPTGLNLDHGKSFDYIKEAISAGYSMVHFDGSALPLAENIKIAKEVAKYAHKKNVLVEGEVGIVKGSSNILEVTPEIKEEDFTSPADAAEFIRQTKVDSLAINIGTFHGMAACGQNPHISLTRLREIKKEAGSKVFLVLHGGSGTPDNDIKEAVKAGIVKININTELRVALAQSFGEIFKECPKDLSPYKYLPQAVSAIQKVVENKVILFNAENKI